MTPAQKRIFFANFGLEDSRQPTLSFSQYRLVITTAAKWHGAMFAQIVADCFIPVGQAIQLGYEDSLSHYVFHYPV